MLTERKQLAEDISKAFTLCRDYGLNANLHNCVVMKISWMKRT
jgi:hypothetical protein